MASPDPLADTLDEGEVTPREPIRRARTRTPIAITVPRADTPPDAVLARAVESLRADDPCWGFAHEVKAAIDAHDARLAELDRRTQRKRWRRAVRWLATMVPVGLLGTAAWFVVDAIADARVAAAAHAKLVAEHAQLLVDVALIKTEVAVHAAAIDLLKLLRGIQ